jgi:hypothetical protein
MRRSLLPGNREISIAVPTSRGRDHVGKAGGRASLHSLMASPLLSKRSGQRLQFANAFPQSPTSRHCLGGVAAMLVVAVARPLGSA